ncbi:MAG: chemotaxis protein CheX [bacterium]|nr:chemotaxis protein CheX [bacterium]
MKIEYINPFLNSAKKVIETMCMTPVKAGKPDIKKDKMTFGVVTGVIGMAGTNVSGNMIISFDEPSILNMVNTMLGETFTTICPEIVDAVGELTNMISSGAKKDLAEAGLAIDMAVPIMLVGKGAELKQLSNEVCIQIPFETSAGKFVIETNLAAKK